MGDKTKHIGSCGGGKPQTGHHAAHLTTQIELDPVVIYILEQIGDNSKFKTVVHNQSSNAGKSNNQVERL